MRLKNNITYLLVITLFFSCTKEKIKADILIINGTVYNGTDTTPNNNAIAIKDDKIVFIGDENTVEIKAEKTIDAKGSIVSPGFIDPHTHADREYKDPKTAHNLPFMMQGITTTVSGNDGGNTDNFFPAKKYKDLYESHGIGTNAILLIGHENIRKQVLGKSDVPVTEEDIKKMQDLMRQEIESVGAFGMSTGLFYAPGSFSETEEIIALAKIAAEYDGIYDTHLRDESSYTVGLIASVEEAIEIGRQAKLPIHLSHIKCLGVDVWHQSDSIIKMVEAAQKEGIEVTANQYPYNASATGIKSATVPRWVQSGGEDSLFIRAYDPKLRAQILEETQSNIRRRGGPEKLLIVKTNNPNHLNKNLLQISEDLKLTPAESVYEILKPKGVERAASFNMNPDDIHNFMKQDWVVTGSDGNTGHPRKYGTFPRKYDKYVKQDSIIDLPTIINGSTSKTAQMFRIPKRGQLKEGYYADVIIFNPNTFKDVADYEDAFQYAA
jgi:N-acyl-D-aspartate/D-glutamate deacylase